MGGLLNNNYSGSKKHLNHDKETIIFECGIMGETDLGIRVRLIGTNRQYWLPKSQIELIEKNMNQHISIPRWLCEQEGIDE